MLPPTARRAASRSTTGVYLALAFATGVLAGCSPSGDPSTDAAGADGADDRAPHDSSAPRDATSLTDGAPADAAAPTDSAIADASPSSDGAVADTSTGPQPDAGSRGCALPGYPTPDCTGVPPGTVFARTVTGDYEVTTPGMVIDRWHITGDLLVHADNVTITNSQIDKSVWNRVGDSTAPAHSYEISDSTIGPESGCLRAAGLQEANYVGTRVLIRGHDHGIDMCEPGNVTLRDSYMTLCWLPASVTPPDGSHVDGIQAYCPENLCQGGRLFHNTMDMRTTDMGTFTLNLGDPHVAGIDVEDNLLAGGSNYVIVAEWRYGPDFVFRNNRVINNSWGDAAPASAEGTCSHQDWSGNTLVTVDANYNVTSTVAPLPCTE